MWTRRAGDERGAADWGWLQARYTFSFSEYRDERYMGFRSLRVMNEDRVAPGRRFDMHPHRDMEIVTIVLEGALEHRDSLGHGAVLRPGEVQRMTAGTGILHSEFNPSPDEPTHLYQIWLFPAQRGTTPSYEQKKFDPASRVGRWQCIAASESWIGDSNDVGEVETPLRIQQEARLSLATLPAGTSLSKQVEPGRHVWLQVLRGGVRLGELDLTAGDGVSTSDERSLQLVATSGEDADAEVLLCEMD